MNIVTCPDCGKKLRLKAEIAPGKRIKCPGCETMFAPDEDEEPEEPEPKRPAKSTVAREPDDEDERERRPARRKRPRRIAAGKGKNLPLLVGLIFLGCVLLLGGLVAAFLLFRGSSYSRHEAALKDGIKIVNDFADALESVKDAESAKTAAGRIEKICDRMEELGKRAESLPKLSQEEVSRLQKEYEPEVTKLTQRIARGLVQAGTNARGEQSFMMAVLRMQRVGTRLQGLGR